jgi:pilus assembly protein CpaF
MNTGHDGSMTTVHANEAEEALFRLETMFQMSDMHFPLPAIRQQIASAVNLIVQQSRMRDKSRKVITIAEVQGVEETENGINIKMQELFAFEPRAQQVDENGKVIGKLTRLTTDRRGRPIQPDNYKLRLLWDEIARYDNAGEELLDDILRLQR